MIGAAHPSSESYAERLPAFLLEILACPRDKEVLSQSGSSLVCPHGHRYAVVEGIPILLVSEAEQTHIEGTRALAIAERSDTSALPQFHLGPGEIDPFVQNSIGATNGSLYQHLVGKLKEYPIPRLRLPPGNNKLLLEIGCNWGRWCLAAAALGYRPIGIDPSLNAIRAARRIAVQLGVDATYLVGDSRFLPFKDDCCDQIFSYSVLQHLSKQNARDSLYEIRRVLRVGADALIQMPNVFGIRCLYHQMRRGFRETRDFEVRYWRPSELLSAFTDNIGPSHLSIDGFFSLNVQPSDIRLLPRRYRALVHASEFLRKLSPRLPALLNVADSLYISSRRIH
ncbi:MAG TPA: methyltransferase domain-containing protein [Candidatus Sulfotelmatobacter sp.]|nr:methyltransferase domain-containing protein [Candidatus Sulfotelmatobacter sp.]